MRVILRTLATGSEKEVLAGRNRDTGRYHLEDEVNTGQTRAKQERRRIPENHTNTQILPGPPARCAPGHRQKYL